jgi:hypothetical protein
MKPEELQELEQQAEKGNPEACVKLSFHLLSAESSNPDAEEKAKRLNQRAAERFKDRLVQSIGKTSLGASDREAASKLHLGILYELGPTGIRRDPVTAFHLIQDALGSRGGVAENPFFPETNLLLSNLESFGYGIYPDDTAQWKQAAAFVERLDGIQKSAFESAKSWSELNFAELELIVEGCIHYLDSPELDQGLLGEVIYLKSRAKFLQIGIQEYCKSNSDKEHKYITYADLVDFLSDLLPEATLAGGDRLLFEILESNKHAGLCLSYNNILSDLEKAASLGNGKAIIELARVWSHIASKYSGDQSEVRSNSFDKAENYYYELARLGCAEAIYNLGDFVRELRPDEGIDWSKYLKIGADMLGPIDEGSFHYLPSTQWNTHIGDQLSACSSLDLPERWKFRQTAEDPGSFVEDDEVFWSASRAERAEAVLRFKIWKQTTRFISHLRRNRPLSRSVHTAERFETMKTIWVKSDPFFNYTDVDFIQFS